MAKSHLPLVSIIISTKNENKNIARVLRSISAQTYLNIEIIVVDNYSIDNTLKIAKTFTKHTYLRGSERSSQRNFGAKRAKGRYLLFLDADMELPHELVSDCVICVNKSKVGALIVPETVVGNGLFARVKLLEKKIYEQNDFLEAPRFFLKKSFTKTGGYNEELIAGEDWDLAARIKNIIKIGRANMYLIHHETSLIRELQHKYYYAPFMKIYWKFHPDEKSEKAGFDRFLIYFRNINLLTKNPLAAIGLFSLKSFEYLLYQIAQ
jgi:glycosyltransferase involved in cell wall biosynthesis